MRLERSGRRAIDHRLAQHAGLSPALSTRLARGLINTWQSLNSTECVELQEQGSRQPRLHPYLLAVAQAGLGELRRCVCSIVATTYLVYGERIFAANAPENDCDEPSLRMV